MEKPKILLVDDEDRFLTTTQKLIVRKGYDIQIASGGTEALEKMLYADIDVVILDVKMPGRDGIDILKEIKNRFPLTEVILLTGHATVESAIIGMRSGAYDYLMKPVAPDELLQKVEAAFARRKTIQEVKSKAASYGKTAAVPGNG